MDKKEQDGKAKKTGRKWKPMSITPRPTQHSCQYDKPQKYYPSQDYVENWEATFGKKKGE